MNNRQLGNCFRPISKFMLIKAEISLCFRLVFSCHSDGSILHRNLFEKQFILWFGLFDHPFSHTCNTRHINYRLQFIYYSRTYNIWTSTQYNIINNNTKFKVEVEFVTTSRYMCIYMNIPKS